MGSGTAQGPFTATVPTMAGPPISGIIENEVRDARALVHAIAGGDEVCLALVQDRLAGVRRRRVRDGAGNFGGSGW